MAVKDTKLPNRKCRLYTVYVHTHIYTGHTTTG